MFTSVTVANWSDCHCSLQATLPVNSAIFISSLNVSRPINCPANMYSVNSAWSINQQTDTYRDRERERERCVTCMRSSSSVWYHLSSAHTMLRSIRQLHHFTTDISSTLPMISSKLLSHQTSWWWWWWWWWWWQWSLPSERPASLYVLCIVMWEWRRQFLQWWVDHSHHK